MDGSTFLATKWDLTISGCSSKRVESKNLEFAGNLPFWTAGIETVESAGLDRYLRANKRQQGPLLDDPSKRNDQTIDIFEPITRKTRTKTLLKLRFSEEGLSIQFSFQLVGVLLIFNFLAI